MNTPTTYDGWFFAQIIKGATLNGEIDGVGDRYRTLAGNLNGLPPGDRLAALESAAAVMWVKEDLDALTMAAAAFSLGDPAPAEAVAPWPALRLDETPAVEPFPLDVLPPAAADLVTEGSAAIGCPPDLVAMPALTVAAGAIGRSVSLKLKDGYFVGACLFAASIGPPSDGKTPALKTAARTLRIIDEALADEHAQALNRWQEECAALAAQPNGKKAKPPNPPRPRRIDVDDVTMEALPLILGDNPRGLVMVRDELTALVMGLNQYKAGGKGNDRANLLKIWSGDAIKKDRVSHENHEPVRCPHPMMSIVGGLTPDMLGELVDGKGRADGFIERFLFAYPDSLPVSDWTTGGVPDDVAEAWSRIVHRLWARPMNVKDGRYVPHVAFFTPAAEDAWRRLYDAHSAEMNAPDFPESMRGAWGKLREYAGRLALVLALLRHAADPTADPEIVPDVAERDVEDGWRLVAYFKSHARRVHAAINQGGGSEAKAVKAIVAWVRSKGLAGFSESELKQDRRAIGDDDRAKALARLVRANAIRPKEQPKPAPHGGRPPLPAYDVNPAIHAPDNPNNPMHP